MRILLLLLLSITGFAQIQVIPAASSRRSVTPEVVSNIQDISITVNPAQYIGTNVSITADANGATVTSWSWRVLHRYFHTSGRPDTLLHETSSSQNPSFSIDSTGFYDVQLIARNTIDKYVVYESRLFVVMKARFTEAEADLVVNMSAGSPTQDKFYDYRSTGTHPDYKIYIKGQTTNGYLEFVDLRGTAGNPVRIQKANDNTQVTIQQSGGSGHPLFFSQYGTGQGARYIEINGFNLDGTPGLKVTAGSPSSVTVRVEGKITDIALYGIQVSAPPTLDAAAIAAVPTVASDCQKSNWAFNNCHVYRCLIAAGEEPVYINESNQSTGYIGNNGFNPPSGYGHVVSRNVCTGSGRDGLQVGSGGGEIEDNDVSNFGQQHDAGGQESCIVLNSGFFGTVKRNKCQNGEMFLNIASGEYAFAPMAGQTVPQPIVIEGNVYKSGTYGAGGSDETHAIYIQNNPVSGAGNWSISFYNNIIDTDNKCAEMLLALGGYTSYNFSFSNNIVISSGGNAGDTPEFNVTGNGKAPLQSGTKTINNLFYSSYNSSLYFTNYATGDFTISNLLSLAYTGSPTNVGFTSRDKFGFPTLIPISGYYFGAYGNYNRRLINP